MSKPKATKKIKAWLIKAGEFDTAPPLLHNGHFHLYYTEDEAKRACKGISDSIFTIITKAVITFPLPTKKKGKK